MPSTHGKRQRVRSLMVVAGVLNGLQTKITSSLIGSGPTLTTAHLLAPPRLLLLMT